MPAVRLPLMIGFVVVSMIAAATAEQPGRRDLADKHAPAGVMGDHLHDRGEWMVEYKYLNVEIVPTLAQNLNGIQLETDFSVIASWSRSW